MKPQRCATIEIIMTTFQYIIDAILTALTRLLPLPEAVPQELYRSILKWSPSTPELQLLVCLVGTLCLLFFFRFDWLGLISACLKSIVNPRSLRASERTLDQHTVLFLTIVTVPSVITKIFLQPLLRDHEILAHPFGMMVGLFLVAGFFQFAANWNKRLKGLNHVRLLDAFFIGALTLLTAHPALSIVAVLWIGFALMNYHYEAIFKYSMLILGIHLMINVFSLMHEMSLKSAFNGVGHLNSIAILVVSITTFWMTLENLQVSLNESTLKAFKWFSVLFGLFYGAVYFIRG